jgi:hypothetical protein
MICWQKFPHGPFGSIACLDLFFLTPVSRIPVGSIAKVDSHETRVRTWSLDPQRISPANCSPLYDEAIHTSAGQHLVIEQGHRDQIVLDNGTQYLRILGDVLLGKGWHRAARSGVGDAQTNLLADRNGLADPPVLDKSWSVGGRFDEEVGAESANVELDVGAER